MTNGLCLVVVVGPHDEAMINWKLALEFQFDSLKIDWEIEWKKKKIMEFFNEKEIGEVEGKELVVKGI